MSSEQERLKKLRERQLTARDPLVKQKQLQQTSAQKERRARSKSYTLSKAWKTIPNIYRSPFIGLLLGLVVLFILPSLWNSSWALWVGLGVTVFSVIIGAMIGNALDIRDNLKDAIKH
jgi:hypothetical protein